MSTVKMPKCHPWAHPKHITYSLGSNLRNTRDKDTYKIPVYMLFFRKLRDHSSTKMSHFFSEKIIFFQKNFPSFPVFEFFQIRLKTRDSTDSTMQNLPTVVTVRTWHFQKLFVPHNRNNVTCGERPKMRAIKIQKPSTLMGTASNDEIYQIIFWKKFYTPNVIYKGQI